MAAEKSLFDLEAYRQEEDEAVRAAARASTWWEEEWLKFPSVSKQPDGSWRYWCVPADSGVYQDDWPLGERLARETVAQMRRFPEGSTVLRRILREMDPESTEGQRSEEHTSELQSLMRISYAVFCLKKKYAMISSYQLQTCKPRTTYHHKRVHTPNHYAVLNT